MKMHCFLRRLASSCYLAKGRDLLDICTRHNVLIIVLRDYQNWMFGSLLASDIGGSSHTTAF